MTMQNWKQKIDNEHILWLMMDRHDSSVNTLNAAILHELDNLLDEITQNDTLKGVVIASAKPSGFIAGADIEQFVKLKDEEEAFALVRQGQKVLDKLAALKIPSVAMIKGFCLGGGLELVLACRYRVAENGAKTLLGAPEVKLGLHPGFGGTVRLPQLIGVLSAMDLNLSGRSMNARTAAQLGLVDADVPERQLEHAARYFVLHAPTPHQPPVYQKMLNYPWMRPFVAKMLDKKLAQKVNRQHYPAPYAIVENWQKEGTFGEGAMVREAKSIAQLLVTTTSRNLVRVFFLQTRMKAQGKAKEKTKNTRFIPHHVHVIGAGTMGGDIAAWCALKGFTVTVQDRTPELIAPAIKRAHALFSKKLKTPRLMQAAMDRLLPDLNGRGVSQADVVIEAILENLVAKQALYQMIESQLKPGALLATNTSSLPLEALASVLTDPTRLVGMHFFNPVAKMPLVEVVHSEQTNSEMIDKAMSFVSGIDHLPLLVKSSPGFLVNRVLMPYLMEALILLEEGVSARAIDKAAVGFGMPMGPIELADVVGLDVLLAVAETLIPYFGGQIPEGLKMRVTQGDLGRKSGRGFYQYSKGKPVLAVKEEVSKGSANMTDRLMLRMLNEAVACWHEKIVVDADFVDAGMIFGTGFAPFRGGPLQYAKAEGIDGVVEKLKALEKACGERFRPNVGWEMLMMGGDR